MGPLEISAKMFDKSVVILSFNQKDVAMVELIKTEVEKLNLNVTIERFDEEMPPRKEVELILKNYVSVLVLGVNKEVVDLFSKIFNQEVVQHENHQNGCTSYGMLANAKVLKINDTPSRCSVLYLQGVLFLVSNFESSLNELVLPYLSSLTKEPEYTRRLFAKNSANSNYTFGTKDVRVTVEHDDEIIYSSVSLNQLFNFENKLKEESQLDIIKIVNNENLDELVYCLPEDHIKKSIKCIENCFEKYGPENVFVSFNGGKDCTVLLHLTLAVLKRKYPDCANQAFCVYVENSNPFTELNQFIAKCEFYYDLDLLKLQKSMKESLQFVLDSRPNMKACLMGTRSTDPHSENLQAFQMTDTDWPQLIRVSPILEWHYSDIWDYLLQLHVPYCNLYDLGYTSLGSSINTIKNPLLIKDDEKMTYFPAHKLFDETKERSGRNISSS